MFVLIKTHYIIITCLLVEIIITCFVPFCLYIKIFNVVPYSVRVRSICYNKVRKLYNKNILKYTDVVRLYLYVAHCASQFGATTNIIRYTKVCTKFIYIIAQEIDPYYDDCSLCIKTKL